MNLRLALTTLTFALAAACPASAQTGGTESGGAVAPTGGHVATVSDGTFSFSARADALLGQVARFRGTLPSSEAGRTVTIERYQPKSTLWVPEAAAVVARDGSFLARWRTDHIGRFRLRARVDSGEARASAASPELSLTIYKPARATWYGPGFYGRRTACGQKMTHALVGIAHRALPCGTQVAIFYGGRTMVLPVVDRGPFRNGALWDLTAAAAQALSFTFTDAIGAVRLREPAP
jgi:hypothetical protein